jgi:hypothetical protein
MIIEVAADFSRALARVEVASGRWAERNRDLVQLDAAEVGFRLLIA